MSLSSRLEGNENEVEDTRLCTVGKTLLRTGEGSDIVSLMLLIAALAALLGNIETALSNHCDTFTSRSYLTEYIYLLVLEGQLPHKSDNVLLSVTS